MNIRLNRQIQGLSILPSLLTALLFITQPCFSASYPLPPEDIDLVGESFYIKSKTNETLLEIGRRYGVGYREMQLANPDVDMWVPGDGTRILIPTQFILPPGPRTGIVLNVAEMRLYYFPQPVKGEFPIVATFPVSIGRMDWDTPLGTTKIIAKIPNPAWHPPQSIRDEHAEDGEELPDVVPPGPDNPLGQYAMRLGIPGYLIHGTNRPDGVGMRVTHGCVRMFPEDIEYFFGIVKVGTPVRIINQPYKAGWLADTLYLEAHPLLEDENAHVAFKNFVPIVEAISSATSDRIEKIDRHQLKKAIKEVHGVPVPISRNSSGI